VHGLAVEREPPPAAEQSPLSVCGRRRGAEGRGATAARGAAAAARYEREHDVVPGPHVGDAGADGLDDPRRLVAERHRHRARPAAVDDREVGVTEAGGGDAHEQLALTRRLELELVEPERSRVDVRPWQPRLVQDGRTRDQARNSASSAFTRAGSSRKKTCPAPSSVSSRAPGMRRASATPFA